MARSACRGGYGAKAIVVNLAGIHPRFRRKLGFAGIAAKLLSAMPRKTQPRRVGFRLARGVPDEDSMGPVAPYQEAVGLHLLDGA